MTADNEVIRINRRIEIRVLDTGESYWSRVEAIDNGALIVAAPMKHGTPVWAPRGTKVRVDIPHEGKRYSFRASVLKVAQGDLSTWTISYPEKLESINLRAFFRLDVSLEAMLRVSEEEADWCKCLVTNLSGNGLLLSVTREFPAEVGSEVVIRLALPDEELMELPGQVVRRLEVVNAPELVQLAVHFPEIKPLTQDQIMRYIFEQQRKLRQRGVL